MRLEQVLDVVKYYTQKHLAGSALSYLENDRKLTPDTIAKFELGYFPFHHETMFNECDTKWLRYHKLGFLNQQGRFRCLLEGRITFPLYDVHGNIVAFQSRKFHKDDQLYDINARKYWHNSFDKSRVLYNLNRALPYIRDKGHVIVGEGQFDAIMCDQYGINNCICASGTALNLQHMSLLARYAKTIYIVFDNDRGGQEALKRLKKFHYVDVDLRYIVLPTPNGDKQDIDSYLRCSGKDALMGLLVSDTSSDSLVSCIQLL